jgi:hypothetical protein
MTLTKLGPSWQGSGTIRGKDAALRGMSCPHVLVGSSEGGMQCSQSCARLSCTATFHAGQSRWTTSTATSCTSPGIAPRWSWPLPGWRWTQWRGEHHVWALHLLVPAPFLAPCDLVTVSLRSCSLVAPATCTCILVLTCAHLCVCVLCSCTFRAIMFNWHAVSLTDWGHPRVLSMLT